MSSTNKTTNYELSQFLGSDKPAWLTDYNGDMGKIDSGIHSAQTTATGADGKADANATKIGTLTSLTTDAKTDLVSAINEVDGHADTAQSTANTATTLANTAKSTADQVKAQFNFTYSTVTCTATVGSLDTNNKTLNVAKNSDGSIAKIYGRIRFPSGVPASGYVNSADTGLRPESDITVKGCCLRVCGNSGGDSIVYQDITLKTDGTVSADVSTWTSGKVDLLFMANVIFVTDFGDLPTPE